MRNDLPTARQRFFALGAGALLAAVLLNIGATGKKTSFDELALGEENKESYTTVGGYPIHGKNLDMFESILKGYRQRQSRNVVLWLGNSQLHAINQAKANATPAPAKLYARFSDRDCDVITLSQPNANLQEHYVLFEFLRQRMNVRLLLLPVVFDDLRNTGVRFGLADALDDPAVIRELERTPVGMKIKPMAGDEVMFGGGDDFAGVRDTLQSRSERFLNEGLASTSKVWESRSELRGRIFLGMYLLRNRAFGISSSSKRKMISGRYALNLEALAATLESARSVGIPVLIYIVPLRADVETPYVLEEYSRFKEQVTALAAALGSYFMNYEDLVPAKYWGTMDDIQGDGQGVDFMHFQEAGHELLADALELRVRKILDLEGQD